MNSWNGTGRLCKDPDIRYYKTEKGESKVASMGIAVRRRYSKNSDRDSDFFDVTAFGASADFAEKYLKKGTKIEITGRLQQDQWVTKEGKTAYRVVIVADNIEFAESKSSQGKSSGSTPQTKKDDDFVSIPEGSDVEELPFS